MADKAGDTQGTQGGMFEFAGAEQASKDAAAVEQEQGQEERAPQQGSDEQTEQGAETGGQEATGAEGEGAQTGDPEQEAQAAEGDPKDVQAKVTKEEPFEVDGRTFASRAELATAYQNSSAEGKRLAALEKERAWQLAERDKQILELEERLEDQPFPGLLSPDEAQEAAQLEMLPQHKQTEYILNKKEWEKQRATTKAQREQRKKQLEDLATQTTQAIEENEQKMSSAKEKYPLFDELKPTRAKIVELTPSIANRPETPYLSYWIAYGLEAFNRAQATAKRAAAGKETAKAKARSAQVQQGEGGDGKPTSAASTGGGASSIVNSYRERTGGGL